MSDWDDGGGNLALVFGRTSGGDEVALRVDASGQLTLDPATSVTVVRAAIRCNTSGNNTIVAAVSGKKIKVLSVLLVAAGDVDVRFESGASGTALTGQMSLAADGNGFVLPPASPGHHWLETAAGALLNLELSGAVYVDGLVVYYVE